MLNPARHYQVIGECHDLGLLEDEAIEALKESQVDNIFLCCMYQKMGARDVKLSIVVKEEVLWH
jgi:hypothetical protein